MTEMNKSAEMQAAIDAIVERVNNEIEIAKTADQRDCDLIEKLNKQLQDDLIPAAIKAHQDENPSFSLPGVNEEKQKFSFAKAIGAMRTGNWADAGFELECFKNMNAQYGDAWSSVQKATGNTGYVASPDGLAGPHLVPEEHMNELIDLFYAESVAFQLGARAMPGAFGTVTIPVLLSGASASCCRSAVEHADRKLAPDGRADRSRQPV
jgi:hypothetical protein